MGLIAMITPNAAANIQVTGGQTGNVYTPASNGSFTANASDIPSLLAQGCAPQTINNSNLVGGAVLQTIVENCLIVSAAVFEDSTYSTSAGVTLSAATIVGGFISRSGPTANFTDTTDNATNIVGALSASGYSPIGFSLDCLIKNTTNFTQTVNAGVGVTFTGSLNTSLTLPPNSQAFLLLQPISATALTIYLAETGNGGTGNTYFAYNTSAATSSVTLSAAQMVGGGGVAAYMQMNGSLSVTSTLTTATAASIIAAYPNATVGSNWVLRITNNSAGNFPWVVASSTAVTLAGNSFAIAQGTWREFMCNINTSNSIGMQSIGIGTYS